MLPGSRIEIQTFAIPQFELDRKDIEDFFEQLQDFQREFSCSFRRAEMREHFFNYLKGLLSNVERKSIEPISIATHSLSRIRPMQRFVSDGDWDDEFMSKKYRSKVVEDLADSKGAIIFDETGFIKKGKDSVGVGRQYCGTIGKVDNCQVGVFCAYATVHGYSFLDKRLYIPESWFNDDHAERREKCSLPETVTFKTKPRLAAEMLDNLAREKMVPYRYILADSIYGNNPDFFAALERQPDKIYCVQLPHDTMCWYDRPLTIRKKYCYRGRVLSKEIVDKSKNPVTFRAIADSIANCFWYVRKVSEGTKGPICNEFTKRRITLAHRGLPGHTVTLIIRRTIGGSSPDYSFFITNAAETTTWATLAWMTGLRWAIEQCFEETKTEIGMDHYEVRKFPGWHHHMLACMICHFFLWHLKIRLEKKSTSSYCLPG